MSILLVCGLLLFLYLLPGIAATYYSASNNTSVLLINIFFGWSIIGWFIAMMLAMKSLSGSQILRTIIFTVVLFLVTIIMAAIELATLASI